MVQVSARAGAVEAVSTEPLMASRARPEPSAADRSGWANDRTP